MYQLVYISTRSAGLAPGDMEAILSCSRRNNAAAGVTGMLLFDGRRFLQALEGDEAAVRATYARIRYNPRHFALVELAVRHVASREFGDLAMADASGDPAGFVAHVDALTARASATTRAHFMNYAGLKAA